MTIILPKKKEIFLFALGLVARHSKVFVYSIFYCANKAKPTCRTFTSRNLFIKRPYQDGKSWRYSISSCKEKEVYASKPLNVNFIN